MSSLVTEIKKLFLDANCNQEFVAEKLGITQSALSKKLKYNTLRTKDLENIASALGYEIKIEFIKK